MRMNPICDCDGTCEGCTFYRFNRALDDMACACAKKSAGCEREEEDEDDETGN